MWMMGWDWLLHLSYSILQSTDSSTEVYFVCMRLHASIQTGWIRMGQDGSEYNVAPPIPLETNHYHDQIHT